MNSIKSIQQYAIISGSYCAFTLTDGALRMLVVLYFYQLGYSPLAIASLFLFYEFFGIVTNLVGGWLASRFGLNNTMHIGMLLQIGALIMLTAPPESLTVIYVMAAQAISGIAKDLNKMSAKAGVKLLLPEHQAQSSQLFRWVAILTGAKNSLKGVGFFIGGLLLYLYDFKTAMIILALGLLVVLITTLIYLPRNIGKTKNKPKFTQLITHSPTINWLSAARFFLFGSRDVWFVVALPVYLSSTLNWSHEQTGGFFALWVIGYGFIQALTPKLLAKHHPTGKSAQWLAWLLMLFPTGIALVLAVGLDPTMAIITGLSLYAVVFAINSAVHSYLIVEWSDHDKVAMNVGFYYMANAGGRLTGTILSGLIFQYYGLIGCLLTASLFVTSAALISSKLTLNEKAPV